MRGDSREQSTNEMAAKDFGCDERFMRLLKLDASLLVHPTSQQSSRWSNFIGAKDRCENSRQQECDGDARSNDQDATALGRCEELAGSAAKVITPMRSMATDRVHVFGPARDVAK